MLMARTSEKEFYGPILSALIDMGGDGTVAQVLKRVEVSLHYREADRDLVAKGEERWRNTARFARKDLVELGLLQQGSPRGRWEISDKGRLWLLRRAAS